MGVGTMLDGFEKLGEGWRVLWSLPKEQQGLITESGRPLDVSWLRVESFVRQRAVLAHSAVKAFLTHGGQSSVNEGIAAGVPLVCMPLFCDQYEVAEAVYRHGLGLVFHKDELLAGQAANLAARLLRSSADPRMRRQAQRYAALMRIREGCGRAGEVIECIAHAGADFQELWCGQPEEAEADASPCAAAVAGGA